MGTTRTMSVLPGAGLCNRLRALISGLVIADETNRTFTAHWIETKACACAWEMLFANAWNIQATPLVESAATRDLSFCRWRNLPDLLAAPEKNLAVKHYSWLLYPARYPHHARGMEKCTEIFAQLRPVPEIAARVDAFQQKHFSAPVIGVHLRRGDMQWLCPDTTNNTEAAIHAVEKFLQRAPGALILLCTDDGAPNPVSHHATRYDSCRERFARHFGSRVLSTEPRSLDRHTPEAIQDALMDLWLLRQSNFFVGTARSSFSELAIFGRHVPHLMTRHAQPQYEKLERLVRRAHLDSWITRVAIDNIGEATSLQVLYYLNSRRLLRHAQRWYRRLCRVTLGKHACRD